MPISAYASTWTHWLSTCRNAQFTSRHSGSPTTSPATPTTVSSGVRLPGHALDTDQALKAELLPLATFTTPNHFETEQLSGMTVRSVEDLTAAARRIHEISGAAVLAKGGMHLPGPDAVDVFVDGDTVEVLSAPKIGQSGVSGAGCSLAAAVTAELAKGATTLEAARRAKEFVRAGIAQAVEGRTPFAALWQGGLRSA